MITLLLQKKKKNRNQYFCTNICTFLNKDTFTGKPKMTQKSIKNKCVYAENKKKYGIRK